MSEEDGASPQELLLESSRRNNTALLSSLIANRPPTLSLTSLINDATDGVGQTALHLAALHGSYEVLDTLLDQEGVEVDPVDLFDRETPLHKAVKFANGEGRVGVAMVEMLLDAGADPTCRNKAGLKPGELVEGDGAGVRELIRKAEVGLMLGDEVVDRGKEEEEGPTGSASDSEG